MGSWFTDLFFLTSALVGGQWPLVSLTPLPLYLRSKLPSYPLDRRLGLPQRRSGRYGEVTICNPTGVLNSDPSVGLPVASRYTGWATALIFSRMDGKLKHPFTRLFFCNPYRNRDYGRWDPLRWPRDILYPQKLALTSPTRGGRSVGIVGSRSKATELLFSLLHFLL
jgi:hypothetical protein